MSNEGIKIVFFGTSDFAVPALRYLAQNGYNIVAVVTQPEKPVGRAKVVMPSPVKKVAVELNIPVFEPHNLKDDEKFSHEFKKLESDMAVLAAYGKIIPSSYLKMPRFGFVNVHPSLLPKYRGPSPIQTAIMNRDTGTGVTIMLMDDKVDHGSILAITGYHLSDTKYYKEAEKDLAEIGAELLLEVLPKYISGELKPKEQDHSKATFTKKITREDGHIDWNKSADDIYNLVRALNQEPGTWARYNDKILNIKTAEPQCLEVSPPNMVGRIIKINNQVAVSTQKCYLILRQIQLEGGKEMDAKAFLNGHPDFLDAELK